MTCLGLAEDDVAVTVWGLVHFRGSKNKENLLEELSGFSSTWKYVPYIFWSSQGNTGDVGDPLQAKAEQGLASLALRTRLDFVEGSSGSRVLLLLMVMVVVIMVVVGVVGCYFLDMRHLQGRVSKRVNDASIESIVDRVPVAR